MLYGILYILLLSAQKILPIKEAWPGCRVVVNEIAGNPISGYLSIWDNLTNVIIVSGIIVFFILAFNRLMNGTKEIIVAAFSNKELLRIETEINMRTNRNTVLLFAIILMSFVSANFEVTPDLTGTDVRWINFAIILAIMLLYIALKYLCLHAMAWLNKTSVFRTLMGINNTFISFLLLGAILGCFIHAVFPVVELKYFGFYALIIATVGLLLFFIRGYQLIISNGFSQFFWILYLCTLELLPLAFVAGFIM